jgi:hypothetical protein
MKKFHMFAHPWRVRQNESLDYQNVCFYSSLHHNPPLEEEVIIRGNWSSNLGCDICRLLARKRLSELMKVLTNIRK